MASERNLIAENAMQGKILAPSSRSGKTTRHQVQDLEDDVTPETPLHSTQMDRSITSTDGNAQDYLPDSNDHPDDALRAAGFDRLDCYIESPHGSTTSSAVTNVPELRKNLGEVHRELNKEVIDFAVDYCNTDNWQTALPTKVRDLYLKIDLLKKSAKKINYETMISQCATLEAHVKEASTFWRSRCDTDIDEAFRIPTTESGDGAAFPSFPNSTLVNALAQNINVSTLPNLNTQQNISVLSIHHEPLVKSPTSSSLQKEHEDVLEAKDDESVGKHIPYTTHPKGPSLNDEIHASDELDQEQILPENPDISQDNSGFGIGVNLEEYDRSTGDIPGFEFMLEDLKTKHPEGLSKLPRNSVILMKKFSQIEAKLQSLDQSQMTITYIHQGIIDHVITNRRTNKSTLDMTGQIQKKLEGLEAKLNDLATNTVTNQEFLDLIGQQDKLADSVIALSGQVSKHSGFINRFNTELSDLKKHAQNRDKIDAEILKQNQNLQAKLSSIEEKISQLTIVISDPTSNHISEVPSGVPLSTGLSVSTSTTEPVFSQPWITTQTNMVFSSIAGRPRVSLTEMPTSLPGVVPLTSSGAALQQMMYAPPLQIPSTATMPLASGSNTFLHPQLPGAITQASSYHRDGPRVDRQMEPLPQRSPYSQGPQATPGSQQSLPPSGRSEILTPEHIIARDLMKESFLMLTDKLKDIIEIGIDDSTPHDKIQELKRDVVPQLDKTTKQCNEVLLRYSEYPGCDSEVCINAIDTMRRASSWVSKLRKLADSKQTYVRPLDKEYKDDLTPFSNDARLNVFEFFKKFEALFQRKGTLTEWGEILVGKYLSPRIKLKVTEFGFDYLKIKQFLISKYGDVVTITNTLLDELESKLKSHQGTSIKSTVNLFTSLLSGIYKIKNLATIEGINVLELKGFIHSRLVILRIVSMIPETYRVEINRKAADLKMDPEKLVGEDALDMLIEYLNAEVIAMDPIANATALKSNIAHKDKSSKPNKGVNNVRTQKSPSSHPLEVDDDDSGSAYNLDANQNESSKKSSKKKEWGGTNYKFPCPITDHFHELGSCSKFFKMTAKERSEVAIRKLCFSCLQPWFKCQKGCRRVKDMPSNLTCKDCKSSHSKGKKDPYNILICRNPDHSKPQIKDITGSLKKWLPQFNPNMQVKLSANMLVANFSSSCHKCGIEGLCGCTLPTKSSDFDPYARIPIIDTHTGQDISVSDKNIIREKNEATVFVMQWLIIRGKEFLTFYDRGASQHLINGQMAEDCNLKVINPRPSTLTVVGGSSISTDYGLYRFGLGKTKEGKVHDIVCQGMSSITGKFPRFDLGEINEEMLDTRHRLVSPRESVPSDIGGTEVHLLLGIKDTELEPKLLFTLPSGLGVYRSKLTDKFGSTICYGGPHHLFTKVYKATHGNVNHFMVMFVNSYRNSLYNMIADETHVIKTQFEDNEDAVLIHKPKGLTYTLDTDREFQCKASPTPLTELDFLESKSSIPEDSFENYDHAILPKETEICLIDNQRIDSSHIKHEFPTKAPQFPEKDNDNQFHHCPILKAKVPLSRLKELLDQSDIDDKVTYRCPDCAKCIKCKESAKTKAISLNEMVEQSFIEKSVHIDVNNRKVFVDMPFTKDPVEFLTARHKGPDNKYQARSVYKTVCRKPPEIKEGIRKAHKIMVDKGYMKRLKDLPADSKRIIELAMFCHFFPWRCVYKEDSLSTPVRIVVDPTMSGLNLILAKGENKLGKIHEILLRLRTYKHIWTSDISKLYNQLTLNPSSYPYSLFLYDDELDPDKEPEIWVMTSAWYGAGSSGGQSECALAQVAEIAAEQFPTAVEPLTKGRFVDDLSHGANTVKDRDTQIDQCKDALGTVGMETKFVAKSGENPPPEASSDSVNVKLLGYKWATLADVWSPSFTELNFNRKVRGAKKPNSSPVTQTSEAIKLMKNMTFTRRMVISKLAELYDPMGLWEPYKLQLKLEASQLNGLAWDSPLPADLQEHWKSRFVQFVDLHLMSAPRCVIPPNVQENHQVRLLCISDAAVNAGGAAVYATYLLPNGHYSCSLLTSKSRLMDGTVPRNELSALLLMTELAYTVKKSLGSIVQDILYVTDSTIAMCWCFNSKKKLRLYALNRVTLIRQMIEWTTGKEDTLPLYHIDGNLNPADMLTKPHMITPSDVGIDSLWQKGYEWMTLPLSEMPLKSYEDLKLDAKTQYELNKECFQEPFLPESTPQNQAMSTSLNNSVTVDHCSNCQRDCLSNVCYGRLDDFDHCFDCSCSFVFSSSQKPRGSSNLMIDVIHHGWKKSLNILAKTADFTNRLKHRIHDRTQSESIKKKFKDSCLICSHAKEELPDIYQSVALNALLRQDTKATITRMPNKKKAEFSLKDGILWYTGRLSEMNSIKTKDVDFDSFFDNTEIKSVLPVVDSDSPLFYALLMHIHTKVRPHSGVEITLREITKIMYVINNPRRWIQRVKNDCTRCRIIQKRSMELKMAQHHEARTTIAPPFYNCMADIAYGFKGKPYLGARKECKIYALVIVCVLTSATSILALEGLQTQNVIQALERHASRYGVPNRVFVDNGTQLVSLQNAEFSIKDINLHVYDNMGMSIEVSSAKAHESRGRVEAKVKILRSMLNKLAINTSTAMTALQWETCFSCIANQIDDIPMAKGNTSNVSDIGWDIITPNRLKLGRNNQRSLSGAICLDATSGMTNLLDLNRKIQRTWYQMLIDRMHHLIPAPRKWLHSDIPKVGDVVSFIYLDNLRSTNNACWKVGRIVEVSPSKRKVTISFPDRSVPNKIPKLRIITRSLREISIIYSDSDFPVNTNQHHKSIVDSK